MSRRGSSAGAAGGSAAGAGENRFLCRRVRALSSQGLHESALALTSLLVSRARSNARWNDENPSLYLEAVHARATALFAAEDYFSAAAHFRMVAELLSELAAHGRSVGAGAGAGLEPHHDAREVSLCEAQCRFKIGEDEEGVRLLEAVPWKSRTCAMHLELARACVRIGQASRKIVSSYKEVLRCNPFAVECFEPLFVHGAKLADVLDLVRPGAGAGEEGGAAGLSDADSAWLVQLARSSAPRTPAKDTKAALKAVQTAFGSAQNGCLQLAMARRHANSGDRDSALGCYAALRQLEPNGVEGMDEYAVLLSGLTVADQVHATIVDNRAQVASFLSTLATEGMKTDKGRPEPWIVAAVAAAREAYARGDPTNVDLAERSYKYLDAAERLEPTHALTHVVRGALLRRDGELEAAYGAVLKASTMRRSFAAMSLLVMILMQMGRLREACARAKSFLASAPADAGALTVLGQVLISSSDGKAQGVKAFTKALQLCPTSMAALMPLAEHYTRFGNHAQAKALLSGVTSAHLAISIRWALAGLHMSLEEHEQALPHVYAVLAAEPSFEAAREMMDAIERASTEASAGAAGGEGVGDVAEMSGDADGSASPPYEG